MNNDFLSKQKNIDLDKVDSGIFAKPIKKLIDTNYDDIDSEDYSLEVVNGRILSKIDSSSGFINDLSVSNIGEKYILYLQAINISDKKFLVISDNNIDATVFSQIFASSLKQKNIDVTFPMNNNPTNFSLGFTQMDEKFGGMIAFTMSETISKILSISFFDNEGKLISKEQSSILNKYIFETEDMTLKVYNNKIDTLQFLDVNNYLSTLPKQQDLSNLKVSINNSFDMNKDIINNFFLRNKIEYIETKSRHPNKNKTIKKAYLSSMLIKSDVALSLSSSNNFFEITILHKKQYHFLNMNDLSAIYLYYLLKCGNFDDKYFNNKYVVTSIASSDLTYIIAKKNGIKVKEYENFLSSLSSNDKLNSNMLFACDGKNYFIDINKKNYISDPFYNLQIFLEMISFFKKQKMTLIDVMEEITTEYGIYRYSKSEQNMDDVTMRKFLNIIKKNMVFAEQKIIRLDKIMIDDKNIWITKFILQDKTKVTFIYHSKINLLKIYLSMHYLVEDENTLYSKKTAHALSKNTHYMDLVVKEKKIIEYVKIFNDDYKKKTTTWKDFFKYFIFVGIFLGIFVILFTTLYNIEGGGPITIFKKIIEIVRKPSLKYIFPLFILLILVSILCNSILIGRMLKVQGQKVKMRHLIISSIIGIVITNITPLSIGGDLAGYWYLRKKSFERGPLIATYLASSLLYQVTGAIIACIFVPMGFIAFPEILSLKNPNSIVILVFSLIGFIGNVIGAIFIGVFSFSNKIQSIFIKLWIKIIYLIPFIVSRDPNSRAASFQYEFLKIRASSLIIFKNIFTTFEFICWRLFPFFFHGSVFLAIATELMKPSNDLWGGQYINLMIGFSILTAANSISITPGGAGTSQYFQSQIFSEMFKSPSAENSIVFSLFSTITFFVFPTIISALVLLTVWMGEKRIEKYEKIKRVMYYENKTKQNKNIRKYTRFHKISLSVWITCTITILSVYYILI